MAASASRGWPHRPSEGPETDPAGQTAARPPLRGKKGLPLGTPGRAEGPAPAVGGRRGGTGQRMCCEDTQELPPSRGQSPPGTGGWWTTGRGSRHQRAGAGLAPAGPLALPASLEREGARLQKEAPTSEGAGLSWGESRVGSGAGLSSSVAWGGHMQKSVTPVTATVAGHLWGCATWDLCQALNWMIWGVAALPAHLAQRASFWPCDRGRTGTRRPAEMRADVLRGLQASWPACSILSCPSDVHVREPSCPALLTAG